MHLIDITMFYAAEGGGVSTYLNAKARWLAQRGQVRHTILSPNVLSGGRAPALVDIPGIALPGIHGYRTPLTSSGPARVLRRLEPDLVEVGDAGQCARAALQLKRRCGTPIIAFYHSDLPQLIGRRFGNAAALASGKYLGHLYRQCDMVLAPSRLMVQQLDSIGVHALHQPLGIDSATFCPQRRVPTLREHLHLPSNARLLVYAGRFTAEKKLPLLIDAVRKLGRPYHLLLIGGGPQVLPSYPQTTYIPFKRDQRQLARLLASCDVLVHPGDSETFGLIVIEAMACGLPVVATTGGGVAELVDEQTGVLVRPNSVDALCAGIDAVFAKDRLRMGQDATRKAREQYSWERIMPQLMHRYTSLLSMHRRGEFDAEGFCVTD